MLFIIHPPVTYVLFQTFNCVEVEGVKRLQQDLSSICFEGSHMVQVLVLALPGLLIWSVGIPCTFLALLMKNRRIIEQTDHILSLSKSDQNHIAKLKARYGIFFLGYKTETYYWEIVIMFLKVLLIFTIGSLSSLSSETQILVALFLIIGNMIL